MREITGLWTTFKVNISNTASNGSRNRQNTTHPTRCMIPWLYIPWLYLGCTFELTVHSIQYSKSTDPTTLSCVNWESEWMGEIRIRIRHTCTFTWYMPGNFEACCSENKIKPINDHGRSQRHPLRISNSDREAIVFELQTANMYFWWKNSCSNEWFNSIKQRTCECLFFGWN